MLCMSPLLLLLLPTSPAVGTLRTSSSSSSVNEVCDWDVCLDAVAGASKRKKDENPNCVRFDINNFDRNSRSIFYGEARGRLGNQLLGYALLQHFRNVIGVDAYINKDAKDYLEKVFTPESITMPLMEDTYCNPEDIPWEYYYGHIKDLLTDPAYRRGKFLLLYPPVGGDLLRGYRPEEHMSKEQDVMQTSYVKYIRKNLKWRPEILTKVKKAFKEVAKKLGKKPKELTYVGIHNRRTDGIEFIKRGWHQDELDEDYFYDAMEYFRDEYDNTAFLYVSDDMDWGRKNLEDREGDLFFIGEGNEEDDSIAFDLAVLRFSNHTIITRGTYSMWGSILCPGEYYTEYGPYVKSVTKEADEQ